MKKGVYEIQYDKTKPNKHFQPFMYEYIGRRAIVTSISERDAEGYKIIFARLKNLKPNEQDIHTICWREYDFTTPMERITLSEDLFEL